MNKDEKPTMSQIFGITIASKTAASCVSYPHEVLRSKIQKANFSTETRFTGLLTCAQWLLRAEGVKGFYAGFASNLVRILPSAVATFTVYE
jgi:solute carrier family 25 folate transporter 32